jgi:hypothetical protein
MFDDIEIGKNGRQIMNNHNLCNGSLKSEVIFGDALYKVFTNIFIYLC